MWLSRDIVIHLEWDDENPEDNAANLLDKKFDFNQINMEALDKLIDYLDDRFHGLTNIQVKSSAKS